jgi:hypothetical protein
MNGTNQNGPPPFMVGALIILGSVGFGYIGLTIANSPVVSPTHGAGLWPLALAVVAPLSLVFGWYIMDGGGRV